MRLIDHLKTKQITAFLTSLTSDANGLEESEVGISSIIDTWILVKMIEINWERNRGLYILKSRGMAHSNQIREFQLTDQGIQLLDVYQGTEGGLSGTARLAQEAKDRAEILERQQELERKQRELERKRDAVEAQISVLRAQFAAEEDEVLKIISQMEKAEAAYTDDRRLMKQQRDGDEDAHVSQKSSAPLLGGEHDSSNG